MLFSSTYYNRKAYSSLLALITGTYGDIFQRRISSCLVDASKAGEGQLEISINDGDVPNAVQVRVFTPLLGVFEFYFVISIMATYPAVSRQGSLYQRKAFQNVVVITTATTSSLAPRCGILSQTGVLQSDGRCKVTGVAK